MIMQRIQLDISNDILDKVMFFLENLPKNKITFNFEPFPKKIQNNNIFAQTAGILSSQKIDPIEWQNQIRGEWDDR